MITDKEMAIVRAALQYFCDEFEPRGDSFESYLSQQDRQFGIANSDLRRVLELFRATKPCLLYTSPSPRDATLSRMPSSA